MISIGNLAVGGRAKTPLAALVARRLLALGERPAILSRGYGRTEPGDGVVVVRDPGGIRADLARAGDEPLMLARQLEGVAVLVSPSRYLAGRLAEHHFHVSVHVLDDGFQHFDLHRDADLVAFAQEDVERPLTLPSGRLREPLDAADAADAFVALDGAPAGRLNPGRRPVWRAVRSLAPVRLADSDGRTLDPSGGPAAALAGIANPERFFAALRGAGWTIAREEAYRDHHPYTAGDVRGICERARSAGARLLIATEKDLVRLLPHRPFALPVAVAPLALALDRPGEFDGWLRGMLDRAREGGAA